jgi:hypothetical protein
LKNIIYREKDAREVLEYEYKQLSHECFMHIELREASDRDVVNFYKSLQKLNEDCERLRGQLKQLEEAALLIARLLVPHPGGPKIAPLVDRLKEAPGRLATYVKHLAKSIPNQVLAYMKSPRKVTGRCLLLITHIRNGHKTTTVITTSHRSREMAVSLAPQRTLVTGTKTKPVTRTQHQQHVL